MVCWAEADLLHPGVAAGVVALATGIFCFKGAVAWLGDTGSTAAVCTLAVPITESCKMEPMLLAAATSPLWLHAAGWVSGVAVWPAPCQLLGKKLPLCRKAALLG